MADLGTNRNWLVQPNEEIKKKWLSSQIQERKSQVVRLKQDIEDLKQGQIVKLEATIMMLDKEIIQLLNEFEAIDVSAEIIKEKR